MNKHEKSSKMREIKFRAWNKTTKRYNNYVEVYCYLDGSVGYSAGSSNNNPIGNTDNFILEQFTGLKDKNGKDIYEGDIIRPLEGYKYFVVFENGAFMCYHCDHKDVITGKNMRWGPLSQAVEMVDFNTVIIGNIYDNPELVNQHNSNELWNASK